MRNPEKEMQLTFIATNRYPGRPLCAAARFIVFGIFFILPGHLLTGSCPAAAAASLRLRQCRTWTKLGQEVAEAFRWSRGLVGGASNR